MPGKIYKSGIQRLVFRGEMILYLYVEGVTAVSGGVKMY
jgi:hypothetical protein